MGGNRAWEWPQEDLVVLHSAGNPPGSWQQLTLGRAALEAALRAPPSPLGSCVKSLTAQGLVARSPVYQHLVDLPRLLLLEMRRRDVDQLC